MRTIDWKSQTPSSFVSHNRTRALIPQPANHPAARKPNQARAIIDHWNRLSKTYESYAYYENLYSGNVDKENVLPLSVETQTPSEYELKHSQGGAEKVSSMYKRKETMSVWISPERPTHPIITPTDEYHEAKTRDVKQEDFTGRQENSRGVVNHAPSSANEISTRNFSFIPLTSTDFENELFPLGTWDMPLLHFDAGRIRPMVSEEEGNTDRTRSTQPDEAAPIILALASSLRSKELLKKVDQLMERATEVINSKRENSRNHEGTIVSSTWNQRDMLQKVYGESNLGIGDDASRGVSSGIERTDARYCGEYSEYPDPDLYLSFISIDTLHETNLVSCRKSDPAQPEAPVPLETKSSTGRDYSYWEYPDPGLYLSLISTDTPLETNLGSSRKSSLVRSEKSAPAETERRIDPVRYPSAVQEQPWKPTSTVQSRSVLPSLGSVSTVKKAALPGTVNRDPHSTKFVSALSPLSGSGESEPSFRSMNSHLHQDRDSSEGSFSRSNGDTSQDGLFKARGHDSISTLSDVSANMRWDLHLCRPVELDIQHPPRSEPRSILRSSRWTALAQQTHQSSQGLYFEQGGRTKVVRFGGPSDRFVVDDMPPPKSCWASIFQRSIPSSGEQHMQEKIHHGMPKHDTSSRSPKAPEKSVNSETAESPQGVLDFPTPRPPWYMHDGMPSDFVEI